MKVELSSGQHRLQHVAGIHGALGRASADHGVELVDEEDDAPFGTLDLAQDRLETLLELTAVLSAGHERAHVESEDRPVLKALRDVAAHDALRQALDDGRLAHPGIADQDRVVLGLPRRIWMTRRISLSRPMTGSRRPVGRRQRGPVRTSLTPRRSPRGWPR